jgi:hypothetical protein
MDYKSAMKELQRLEEEFWMCDDMAKRAELDARMDQLESYLFDELEAED